MTLLKTLEATVFSDEDAAIFAGLVDGSPTDGMALVVLAAAASLLARDAVDEDALYVSLGEFVEVAQEMRQRMFGALPTAPVLTVVGGSDFTPSQKEA